MEIGGLKRDISNPIDKHRSISSLTIPLTKQDVNNSVNLAKSVNYNIDMDIDPTFKQPVSSYAKTIKKNLIKDHKKKSQAVSKKVNLVVESKLSRKVKTTESIQKPVIPFIVNGIDGENPKQQDMWTMVNLVTHKLKIDTCKRIKNGDLHIRTEDEMTARAVRNLPRTATLTIRA